MIRFCTKAPFDVETLGDSEMSYKRVVLIIINKLILTRIAHNSHTTEKPVALEFPIESEFRNAEFCER